MSGYLPKPEDSPVDAFDSEEADDSPNLVCAHFIACHTVRYDGDDADAGCTLERVIVHVRPSDANGFPFCVPRMFVFAQLHGPSHDYVLRVRLLRISVIDDEEVVATRRDFTPRTVSVTGEHYVECFAIPLTDVWFPEPSVYEFQLWVDGHDEPLARERIQARE
jgi:hypothetical protein